MKQERILYEDQDIIVCHKPAGIATQTARVGQADMVSEVTNYLARTGRDPYAGLVHRLDQPVEGILVFACNQQAAAALSRQMTENRVEKYYYAVVCGNDFQERGELTDYLVKDSRTNMSRIVPPEVKGTKKAVLEYEILSDTIPVDAFAGRQADMKGGRRKEAAGNDRPEAAESGRREAACAAQDTSMVALAGIRLLTGRHHQIRVQMSNAGMSLLGDRKYADARTVRISEELYVREVALCAGRLSLMHPRTGRRMAFTIRPEGKIFQAQEFVRHYI